MHDIVGSQDKLSKMISRKKVIITQISYLNALSLMDFEKYIYMCSLEHYLGKYYRIFRHSHSTSRKTLHTYSKVAYKYAKIYIPVSNLYYEIQKSSIIIKILRVLKSAKSGRKC